MSIYLRKTFFVDVDGTLIPHVDFDRITEYPNPATLPGAKEKLLEWSAAGHTIIITTARPESMRDFTVQQLHNCGIVYDLLIMGLGAGERVVINDVVPGSIKARAFNVARNIDGLIHVDVSND